MLGYWYGDSLGASQYPLPSNLGNTPFADAHPITCPSEYTSLVYKNSRGFPHLLSKREQLSSPPSTPADISHDLHSLYCGYKMVTSYRKKRYKFGNQDFNKYSFQRKAISLT